MDELNLKETMKKMGKALKSKQAVMVMLLCLIGVAGYLNMSIGDEMPPYDDSLATMVDLNKGDENLGQAAIVNAETKTSETEKKEPVTGYFASAKIERETGRSKSLELLKTMLDNPNTDAENKAKVQKNMMDIASYIDMETNIENLIKAKGFSDVVAYVNENGVVISVKAEAALVASDEAKIREIVTEQSKMPVTKIKIVPIK